MELDFFKDIKDTFLDHVLFKAISLLPKEEREKQIKGEKLATEKSVYDIEFIVNGHKLPVVEAFNIIRDQLDFMVKSAASKLVNEKMDEELAQIHEIGDVVANARLELQRKINKILGTK